jgi:hypothetical protein
MGALSKDRLVEVMLALLAGGSLVAAAIFAPGTNLGGCWVHSLLGVDCPFCGMTRSFLFLMHGDVAASFRAHPGGPLLALAFVYVLVTVFKNRPRAVRALEASALICLLLGLGRAI